MEDQWLAWAKRLQAIASTGLHFCEDDFDRQRYRDVAAIAQSMLASLGNVPIERIEGLLSDFAKGYATPKIDVRGAVIEDGKVLLVREKSDGLWTLPGGFADVGLSATENVTKEVWEEAGIRVSVTGLYSVRHKAKQPYEPDTTSEIFTRCSSCAGRSTQNDRGPASKSWTQGILRAIAYRTCPEGGSLLMISRPPLRSTTARHVLRSSTSAGKKAADSGGGIAFNPASSRWRAAGTRSRAI